MQQQNEEKEEPLTKKQKQEEKLEEKQQLQPVNENKHNKKLVQPTISQTINVPTKIDFANISKYDYLLKSIGSELYHSELKANYVCIPEAQRGMYYLYYLNIFYNIYLDSLIYFIFLVFKNDVSNILLLDSEFSSIFPTWLSNIQFHLPNLKVRCCYKLKYNCI